MIKVKKYKFWLLIGILLFGGVLINWFEQRGEASVERKPLSEIPAQLGDWKKRGEDIRFEKETESILRTSDYIMREYFLPSGRVANVYVGYYASQRTGATYHSPQNCLPGAGWEMKSPGIIKITTPSGTTFEANHYIIENDKYKEVLIYWYQGRGRAVASEYNDKIYTVLDSILRQRSDGSMVRVMTGFGNSEAESTQAAIDLSAQLADNLSGYVPD
jgi:EpsI family protein